MMTNRQILDCALRQSAIDMACEPNDFLRKENVVTLSRPHSEARRYLTLPLDCGLVSYGSNIVATVTPTCLDAVSAFIQSYPVPHCFETPNLHVLDESLRPHGLQICFMAEFFLPDAMLLQPLPCPFRLRVLTQQDFHVLYRPEWSNALCEKRKELDVIGVGAYDSERLIGLAGASADCDSMWQIGIDVLPDFRRLGVASALTSRLAIEILNRGKVPFYCAAWSNIPSVRNAIRSAFRPAWVEVTAKSIDFVRSMNRV